MARTIDEIKQEMGDAFISNATIKQLYGIESGKSFNQLFAAASIENILFNALATGIWALEKIFDRHTAEVTETINQLKPHSLRWYVNMAKQYQHGHSLVDGETYYDNSGLTDEEIEEARVVKYAVATEMSNTVIIKVASLDPDTNRPMILSDAQMAGLRQYISEIKDAGVYYRAVTGSGDALDIAMTVYYAPAQLSVVDDDLSDGDNDTLINSTIQQVIADLPFNAELEVATIADAVRALPGVKTASVDSISDKNGSISAYCISEFGYFILNSLSLNLIPYSYE